MAPFNPDVPKGSSIGNDPSYLGYSHPISPVEGDKTIGTALAGIGNLVEEGAKGIDLTVRDIIDRSVHNQVDAVRDAYTNSLDQVKTITSGQPVNNPAASLMADNTSAKPPQPLGTGIDAVNTLSSAFQAGKVSPTYYYGQLNALAKNLRNQYPGWRDFIDQKISEVSGGNPANEYVKSISADINNSLGLSKSEQEKNLSFLREHANVDGGATLGLVFSGKMTPQEGVLNISKSLNHQYQLTISNLEANNTEKNLSVASDIQERGATEYVNNFFATKFNNSLTAATISGQKIDDILNKVATGEMDRLPAAQKDQLLKLLIANRDTAVKEAKAHLMAPDPRNPGGKSPAFFLKEKLDTVVNNGAKIYDLAIDRLTNDKYGEILDAARLSTGMVNDARLGLYTDPDIGHYQMQMNIINKDGGPEASKVYFNKVLSSGALPVYQRWIGQQTRGFMAQPDLRQTGNANTVLKSVFEAKKANVTDPNTYNYLMTMGPEMIANPKIGDGVKENLIHAYYDPSNNGLFNHIKLETQDPRTGASRPGRSFMYTKQFAPDVTKAVKAYADTHGEQFWHEYKDRAETAFGSEIFGDEIRNLNNVSLRPDVRLTWDSDNHRWDLKPITPAGPKTGGSLASPTAFRDYEGYNQAQRTINRLNMGIQSMVKIAEADGRSGSDVDAYLMQLMVGMGFAPTKAPQTLPEAMLRTITTQRMKEQLNTAQKAE